MLHDFEPRLHAFADVIVRVGLNLQPGQRLLITEPYELQGVARSAECIVDAVRTIAGQEVEVIWGEGARLRAFAENDNPHGFARLADAHAKTMAQSIRNGDALLFLQGSQPGLMDGIPPGRIAELRRISLECFGPIAQQLVQGATNWTAVPAPSPGWATVAYADLPAEQRLDALWETVFAACRVAPGGNHFANWPSHLAALARRRDELNARRLATLRYQGAGTDLTVTLPREHRWCTAQLMTKTGLSFVANLPTEEVFTVPHKDSTAGLVRLSRPINYGGAVIDGIELEFRRGRIVEAQARTGAELLGQLLATDEGATRLGEVAMIGNAEGNLPPNSPQTGHSARPASWNNVGRLFYHPLLDENASNHIALGEAYGFCLRSPNAAAMNRSLIHVDLPVDASVTLPNREPA